MSKMSEKKSIPKPYLIRDLDKKILTQAASVAAGLARQVAVNESLPQEATHIDSRSDLSSTEKETLKRFYRRQLANGLSIAELEKAFKDRGKP
jgi:hypothetical protein